MVGAGRTCLTLGSTLLSQGSGRFYKLGVLFVGLLIMRALLFALYFRVPDLDNSHLNLEKVEYAVLLLGS